LLKDGGFNTLDENELPAVQEQEEMLNTDVFLNK
jgi:hypothetical protein